MAYPVVKISSTAGNDVTASGAGPATAITGSNASTSADGLTVTLTGAGSLTGVATDGSAVLFLNDSTAGARNFGAITGVNDGTKEVTITAGQAFRTSASGLSWAIGGMRASLGAATTRKLTENNSAAGDAMPGWVIEPQASHSEVLAASVNFRRAGNVTDGPIVLRGATYDATMPSLRWTAGRAFDLHVGTIQIENLQLLGWGTTSDGIYLINTPNFRLSRLKIGASGYGWRYGVNGFVGGGGTMAVDCEASYCTTGFYYITPFKPLLRCVAHHCNVGFHMSQSNYIWLHECRSYDNVSHGLLIDGAGALTGSLIRNCTMHGNGGDGIRFDMPAAVSNNLCILNNNLTGNTGFGFNITDGGHVGPLTRFTMLVSGNNYGAGATANTAGDVSTLAVPVSEGAVAVDPQYVDAANGDFTPGNAALRGTGWPQYIGTVRSYPTPGAMQPQASSGSTIIIIDGDD